MSEDGSGPRNLVLNDGTHRRQQANTIEQSVLGCHVGFRSHYCSNNFYVSFGSLMKTFFSNVSIWLVSSRSGEACCELLYPVTLLYFYVKLAVHCVPLCVMTKILSRCCDSATCEQLDAIPKAEFGGFRTQFLALR